MMLKDRLGRKGSVPLFNREQQLYIPVQCLRYGFRRSAGDCFSLTGRGDGRRRDAGKLRELGAGQALILQKRRNIGFCGGLAAGVGNARLTQILIESVQMLWAKLGQLDMPDRGVDPLQQLTVTLCGAVFCAGAFLQLNDVIGVLRKGLSIVELKAKLNVALKVGGGALDGLLHLPLRHGVVGRPRHIVPQLLAGAVAPFRDGYFIGDAVFALDFSNVCHVSSLRDFTTPLNLSRTLLKKNVNEPQNGLPSYLCNIRT